MGNRAVITTRENFENNGVGIYLHWNGGRDSVEAFLKYCELKQYRAPSEDNYGWSCLANVISNFFGNGLSIGIDTVNRLDCNNGDNGVYIIEGWKIVDRKYLEWPEQDTYNLEEMLLSINEAQPEEQQIPEEFFTAIEVPTNTLKVGDQVFVYDNWVGKYKNVKVHSIGEEGKVVNGTNVTGIPCVSWVYKYGDTPVNNINNYIRTETIRKVND